MSKQSNTAIFLIVATILNIILMFAIFIIFFIIAGLIFDLNGNLGLIMLGLSFIVAIGGSIFIYSKMVSWAVVKFNLEDKLVPIFSKKRSRKK
jgi:hypothetical protein